MNNNLTAAYNQTKPGNKNQLEQKINESLIKKQLITYFKHTNIFK